MKVPALVLFVLLTSTASAQSPLTLKASLKRAGRIRLDVTGPPAEPVNVAEGDREVGPVTLDAAGKGTIAGGTWSCTTRERTFTVASASMQATATVRTPTCAHRYRLSVRPRHPRATRLIRVHVTDAFHLGGRPRVCARGPAHLRVCTPTGRLRLPRPGAWTVSAGGRQRALTVRRRPGHLRLLATGDSMIQIIDGFLKQRLAAHDVGVRSDAHISTGLSKPFMFDWPVHAQKAAASYHPDLTIVFIGANDGYPFGKAACCGRIWRRRYAKRVSGMMSTYARHGAGTVFWCLLPAPRDGRFRRVFVAVNAAIRRAARRHPGTVHLVDLPRTFTPGYRFRPSMNGTVVRQDDGVHFTVAGASIAANLMIRALRRAGRL